MRGLIIGLLVGTLCCQGLARADEPISSLDTVYMDVGLVYATDAVSFGEGMGISGEGLRYYERHCCLARFLAAISIGILMSAGASSNIKSQSSTTYQSGDYLVTETTTTYNTPEEMEAKRKAAAEATASILTFPFTMELVYFPQKDDGKLHGFQWTWYLIDYPKRRPYRFETGFHWDRLYGDVAGTEMSYRNAGIPFKLVYRPMEFIQFDGEFRWSLFYASDTGPTRNRNQMVRGSVEIVSPIDHALLNLFYGRATLQSNNVLEPGRTGYMIEFGVRL